jgi:hypothetical protein
MQAHLIAPTPATACQGTSTGDLGAPESTGMTNRRRAPTGALPKTSQRPSGEKLGEMPHPSRSIGLPNDPSGPRLTMRMPPAGAQRAARLVAAEGDPTDEFWLGTLAIGEGRWTDLDSVRRVLQRQDEGSAYAAALRAYAALARGDRGRLAEFESALARLPVFGWDVEQPQQYLCYTVGKLLFDDGRTRDAERYFQSFQPYDYFYTTPAELYLGRIADAGGHREEAATHYGRFARWWRYADEEARRALAMH